MTVKIMKKAFSFAAVLVMLSTCVFAADTLSGSGTKQDPYSIASPDDLCTLARLSVTDSFEGKFFALTNDIAFENDGYFTYDTQGSIAYVDSGVMTFKPIGSASVPFKGLFDGKGYSVRGLCLEEKDGLCALFGYADGAQISNLIIFDSYASGSSKTALLCADASGGTVIDGVNVSGTVVGKGERLNSYTAGICASNGKSASIINSVSYANVSGSRAFSSYTGGIAGINFGNIDDSAFGGSVKGKSAYFSACTGGIAGGNHGLIGSCLSNGKVEAQSLSIITDSHAGGIAGENAFGASIFACANYSAVTNSCYSASDSVCSAGGIAGYNHESNISACVNYGKVSAQSVYCGGIAGIILADEGNLKIEDCYNAADISSAGGVSGGISGMIGASDNRTVQINTSLNVGTVSGDKNGGVAASYDGKNVIHDHTYFADNGTTDEYALKAPISRIQSNTVLPGFDSSVWVFESGNFPRIVYEEILRNVSETVSQQVFAVPSDASGLVPEVDGYAASRVFGAQNKTGLYDCILFFENSDGAFAPVPAKISLAVVDDINKAQIVSMENNLVNDGGIVSGNVEVSIYFPDGTKSAFVVGAVYNNEGRMCSAGTVTANSDGTVSTANINFSAAFTDETGENKLKLFIFDSEKTLSPSADVTE